MANSQGTPTQQTVPAGEGVTESEETVTDDDLSSEPEAQNQLPRETGDAPVAGEDAQTDTQDEDAKAILVSLDANGGSGSLPDVTVEPFGGTPVTIGQEGDDPAGNALPRRTGFTLVGWSTQRRLSSAAPLDEQGGEVFVPVATPLTDGEYRYVESDGADETPHARRFVGGKTIELVSDALAPGSRDDQGRRVRSASLLGHGDGDGRVVLYAVWDPDGTYRDPEAGDGQSLASLTGAWLADACGQTVSAAEHVAVTGMRLLPREVADRAYLRTPEDAGTQASVTRDEGDGIVAAMVEGLPDDLPDGEELRLTAEDVLVDSGGLSADEARDVSVRMFPTRHGAGTKAGGDGLSSSLDGTDVKSLELWWVTEDSPDSVDGGQDDILYRRPGGDEAQSVKMKLSYALSGEFDYDEGDIRIYLPAKMFTYRDGTAAGQIVIPYPQAPSRAQDFNWERVGDQYVLTNTRRMSAATKGFMELAWRDLTPHRLVDMADSLEYEARIEVTTHRGNTIGLTSNSLVARFDTEQQVTGSWKQHVSHEWVAASEVPERQRVPGETDYLVVTWQAWAEHYGNTEFTLRAKDTPTDAYQGKVIEEGMAADGTMTYGLASGWQTNGGIGYVTARVAYPGSQFAPDTDYLLTNSITYTLTEADPESNGDPQKVTEATAEASLPFRWHEPVFDPPKGHFMMNKIGNDGASGKDSGPYWSRSTGYGTRGYYKGLDVNDAWGFFHNTDDGYGIYPSALNDVLDGQGVALSYTVESEGYLLPWTLDGDATKAESYGRKPVTMTTYDTDETQERQLYLADGTALEAGVDYEYASVEFPLRPDIGRHVASNLAPDGTFVATHAGDGTFIYAEDPNATNIPPISLEAKIGDVWVPVATVIWTSGSCVITPRSGFGDMVQGQRVLLPTGVTQVRTQVTSTNAYIWYYFRPTIKLKASERVTAKVQELFSRSFTPSTLVYNTGSMYAYDSTGGLITEFHKSAYDELRGYTTDVAIYPYKNAVQTGESYEDREVTIHYEATVQERTFISDMQTYEQAVSDGRLTPDTQGVFYDLLPKGVTPLINTVRLRNGDSMTDVNTIEDYRGTGRILLVVRANLSPRPTRYLYGGIDDYRIMDAPAISFDATCSYDSVRDYGDRIHNVIAYESLARQDLGTVTDYMGEYDNPTGSRNVATQTAFADDGDIEALTGIDPDSATPSFAYAGTVTAIEMLGAAQTSLSKNVMVNNDGRWSQGTYEDRRTVYEGGVYAYRLSMTSDAQTVSKGLILYDSLENFQAGNGNDPADVNAPRWRGTLQSVDVSLLQARGVAPVVYYSTVDDLRLSKATDPNAADPDNTNLGNGSVWVRADAYQGSLEAVHAVAIDARKNADGTDFVLNPEESASVTINMHAPSGPPARTYIEQSAHAYNNVCLLCDSIDANNPETHSADHFIHQDYTKVGLMEHSYVVTKVWDDNDDQDGLRPQSVTLHLLEDGVDNGRSATIGEQDGWVARFEHIPYSDGTGRKIQYSVTENPVTGYAMGIARDGTNVTVTNTHRPETTGISGTKHWEGDEDHPEARPASIRVALLADGTVAQTKRVVPDAGGRWLYEFTDLPRYRDHGTEIEYGIEEQVDYYSSYVFRTESGYDIRNTYHPYGDLEIDKTVLRATQQFAGREFDVIVTLTDSDGVPLTGTYAWSDADGGATGTIRTGGTVRVHDGSKVTIRDIPENSLYRVEEAEVPGYAVSTSGTTGTVHPNTTAVARLTNTYSATGFVNLTAGKTLRGRDMTRYQFRFQLLDANGNVVRTAANMEDGTVTYGALSYTEADAGKTFSYVMREVDRQRPGYDYDETTYVAKVTVTDNGDGTLGCSVAYETVDGTPIDASRVPSFSNAYEAHGSIQLRAWKQLTGGELANGQFSFQLLGEDGTVLQTKANDANGNIMFDPIEYDQEDAGKKYKYVVKEVAGNDSAIIYDDDAYGYEVTVADNGDGTLLCTTGYVEVDKHRMTWSEMDADERQYHAWLFIQDNVGQNPCLYDPDFEFVGSNEIKNIINMTAEEHSTKSHYGLYKGIGPNYGSTSSTSAFPLSSLDTYPVPCFILNDAGVAYVRDYLPTWTVKFDPISKYMFFAREGYFDLCSPLITDGVATAVLLEDIDVYIPTSTAVDTAPVFRNSYKPGNLAISKSTSDDTPADRESDEFRFKVKLTGPDVPDEITYNLEQHPQKTRVRISAIDKDTQQTVPGATFTGAGTWTADQIDPNDPPVVQVAMTQTPEGYAPTGRVRDVTHDVWYETPFDLTVTESCELEYELVSVVQTKTRNLGGCRYGITNDGYVFIYPANGVSGTWYAGQLSPANDIVHVLCEKGITVSSTNSMFVYCSNLQDVDISRWDLTTVSDMTSMFDRTSSLQQIILGEKTKFADSTGLTGIWTHGDYVFPASELIANYDGNDVTMVGTWTRQDTSGGGGVATNIVSPMSALLSAWDGLDAIESAVTWAWDGFASLLSPTVAYATPYAITYDANGGQFDGGSTTNVVQYEYRQSTVCHHTENLDDAGEGPNGYAGNQKQRYPIFLDENESYDITITCQLDYYAHLFILEGDYQGEIDRSLSSSDALIKDYYSKYSTITETVTISNTPVITICFYSESAGSSYYGYYLTFSGTVRDTVTGEYKNPRPNDNRLAFTGWNTASDGTGTANPNMTSSGTLYAQWANPLHEGVSGGVSWAITCNNELIFWPTNGVSGQFADGVWPWREYLNDIVSVSCEPGVVAAANMSDFLSGYVGSARSNKTIKTIDLRNLDTSQTTNMRAMFYALQGIQTLNLHGWNTSHVTTFYDWLGMYGANQGSSLRELDISTFDTSSAQNMASMFNNRSMSSFDLSHFNLSSCTTTNGMFSYGSTPQGMERWNTSHVTDMQNMFSYCQIGEGALSNLDTSSCTNMAYMFQYASGDIDVSNFKTTSVKNMAYMFYDAYLPSPLDLSHFDTSNVTNMAYMFYNARGGSSKINVVVDTWNTSHVTNMSYMFAGSVYSSSSTANGHAICDLTKLDVSAVTNFSYMFYGNAEMDVLDLSTWDMSEATTTKCFCGMTDANFPKPYTRVSKIIIGNQCKFVETDSIQRPYHSLSGKWRRIDEPSSTPITGADIVALCTSGDSRFYGTWVADFAPMAVLDDEGTLTFAIPTDTPIDGTTTLITPQGTTYHGKIFADVVLRTPSSSYISKPFSSSSTDIKVITVDENCVVRFAADNGIRALCYELTSLQRFDGSRFDVANQTDFTYMFYGCSQLVTADLSSFNTQNATSMKDMFSRCSKLSSVKLGEDFTFQGASGTSTANMALLPDPPYDYWVNLEKDPTVLLTSTRLRDEYTGSDASMVGTWTWSIPEIKFMFMSNGGIGAMDPQSIQKGSSATLTKNAFTMFDHTFVSWNTAPDGSGTVYADEQLITKTTNDIEQVTLYAQWQQRSHRVTLEDGECYVTVPANSTLTLPNLPAGTSYQVYEETAAGWTLIDSSETAGMVVPTGTVTASFTNRYDPNETSIQLAGAKTLDGNPVPANAFSFVLREGSTVIQTVWTQSGGGFTFSPITYTSAGSHTYTITEAPGNDGTINYDTHTETVQVSVTDDGGVLSATATYDGDGIAFANTTKPGALTVSKSVTGQTDANRNDSFTVSVHLTDAFGQPLQRASVSVGSGPAVEQTDAGGTFSVSLKANEQATFSDLPAGTMYSVTERDIPAGWALTSATDAIGTISAATTSVVSLTNTYSATGEVTPQAWKALNGRAPRAGEFSFELIDEDATGRPVIDTATNDAMDTRATVPDATGENEVPNPHLNQAPVSFGAIRYTGEGTHHYTIHEVAGDDASITYDTTTVGMTVTVTDAGHGNLRCSVTYDRDDWLFENEVQTDTLSVMKVATGVTPNVATETFSFTVALTDPDGDPLPDGTLPLTRGRMTDGGVQVTGTTTCSVSDGTVSLALSGGEVATIGGLPIGTAYAVTEGAKEAWRTSASGGETGTISVASAGTAGGATVMFDNEYRTAGTFSIAGTKDFVGKELEAGRFDFVLRDAAGELMARATNDADGTFSFDGIAIEPGDAGKTLTYHVSEVSGGDPHIAYDGHVETITVLVSDDGQGHLSATPSYDGDGCGFVNRYVVAMPTTGLGGVGRASLLAAAAVLLACLMFVARQREERGGDGHGRRGSGTGCDGDASGR